MYTFSSYTITANFSCSSNFRRILCNVSEH